MTGGRVPADPGVSVDDGVDDGRESRLHDLLGEAVEAGERGRRLHPVERERSQAVPELPHGRGRLHALADDVAHHEPELAVLQPDRIEPVAADGDPGRARKVAGGELHAFDAGQGSGQDTSLKGLRDRLLGLECARAVECLGGLTRERFDESPLLGRQ